MNLTSPSAATVAPSSGLDRWDRIGIAVGCASLLLSCILSTMRDPYFWYDEVATLSLVRDPSLAHMVGAIARGAENNPPLYTVLLRGWARLFGNGALPLRLLSALFFCGALAAVWRTLRAVYSTRQVALGIACVFFGVQAVFEQAAQARFYGLFVFVTAIAFAVAVRTMSAPVVRGRDLVVTLIAHTVLVYTHMFGLLFSGAILAAMIVFDARQRRFRLALYAAVVGAWLLWALYAPLLLSGAMSMRGSRSWLARPQRDDLIRLVARQTTWLPLIAAAIAFLEFFRKPADPGGAVVSRPHEGSGRREATIAAGVALLAVVPLVFIISRIAAPAFLDRYLLPSALGWTVVVAQLLYSTNGGRGRPRGPRWEPEALGALFCLLALYPVAFALAKPSTSRPVVAVADSLASLPIVVESGHDFWPLLYYSPATSDRYRFLLDEGVTRDEANFAGGVQEYGLMTLYSNEGYLRHAVEQRASFECTTPRFLVLDRPEFVLYERRFAANPAFRSAVVGSYDGAPIRLVERARGSAGTPDRCSVSGGRTSRTGIDNG